MESVWIRRISLALTILAGHSISPGKAMIDNAGSGL